MSRKHNFLVIETCDDLGREFMHFIELSDLGFLKDIESLLLHMGEYFPGQKLKKVYFSDTRLSNW